MSSFKDKLKKLNIIIETPNGDKKLEEAVARKIVEECSQEPEVIKNEVAKNTVFKDLYDNKEFSKLASQYEGLFKDFATLSIKALFEQISGNRVIVNQDRITLVTIKKQMSRMDKKLVKLIEELI